MIDTCPACHSKDMHIFYELSGVPIQQNTPKATLQDAYLTPVGDITMACCRRCGFVSNLSFDNSLEIYTANYNNIQTHSATFQKYVGNIASMLIERFQLRDKHIIEIGHGQGDFLIELCQAGNNRGTGYDPSYTGEATALHGRVVFVQDFYSDKYSDNTAELFVARHLIEHVQDLDELVGGMRRAIGQQSGVAVFFETPDVRWILEHGTFWDLFYEHCSLFSPGSLARLFARHGFEVLSVKNAFGQQYQWLEALSAEGIGKIPSGLDTADEILSLVERFKTTYLEKLNLMQRHLQSLEVKHQRAAIWGAAAKGVTFLNTLKPSHELVPIVVDINPDKQGQYIPGTGQKIVSPEHLKDYDIDTIFVMNPNYLEEIKEILSSLRLRPHIIVA